MERKLDIYRKYKDEMGVSLNKKERQDLLLNKNFENVGLFMTRKMVSKQQEDAAILLQRWFKKSKHRAWFSLIAQIRKTAASKI